MFIVSAIAHYARRRLEIGVAREMLHKMDRRTLQDIGITHDQIDAVTENQAPRGSLSGPIRIPASIVRTVGVVGHS